MTLILKFSKKVIKNCAQKFLREGMYILGATSTPELSDRSGCTTGFSSLVHIKFSHSLRNI